mgnify:CR=1 FL=1
MFSECCKTEAIFCCPTFYFSIISSCCNINPIWRISQTIHIKEMTLLLKNVCFRFPFPHKQLPFHFTCHCNPVTSWINWDAINFLFRYLKTMDWFQSIQIEQTEYTVWLANTNQFVVTLIYLVNTNYSRLSLNLEFVFFLQQKSSLCNFSFKFSHELNVGFLLNIFIWLFTKFQPFLLFKLLKF